MNRRSLPFTGRLLTVVIGTLPRLHVHRFRWAGEDLYGNGSHYRCRCGVVRPGL